jgi:hypothetical protein
MAAMIGNDILDIGNRKARRQMANPAWTLGAPGQFDLPNVADVGIHTCYDDFWKRTMRLTKIVSFSTC